MCGAYREEEVGDVVRDVDREAHVREVEAVAEPDERDCYDVVSHQLLEIFPRLLELQHQHHRLLRPVRRLQQVISLEEPLVRPMWEVLKHGRGVEIPHRAAVHHVQAIRSEHHKVHRRVRLLHEARLLRLALDAAPYGPRSDYALHKKLAREGEDDHVECDEGEVAATFAILCGLRPGRRTIVLLRSERVGARKRVGEEDHTMDRIRGGRVERVEAEDDECRDEGSRPGVTERERLVAAP